MRIFKENGVEKVAATMRDPDPAIVVLKTDGTEVFIVFFSKIKNHNFCRINTVI